MIDQLNFITTYWNLESDKTINWSKTTSTIVKGEPILDLYLNKHINSCPFCNSEFISIRSSKITKIKTVTSDNTFGLIYFHKRIYKCMKCMKVFSEKLNLINKNKNVSLTMDLEILEKLKDPTLTYKKISNMYNVSITYVQELFDKHVDIRRLELNEVLSIDEIYSRKLTKTKYCCIIYDPIKNRIIDVIDSRHYKTLEEYLYHIPLKERESVIYFTSDLNNTYKSIINNFFPNAVHAVDSFHVIKNLNEYLNIIRIRVMKHYESIKSNSSSYWLLKKFSKLLFINYDDIENKEYDFKKFNMILDKSRLMYEMLNESDELKEAYYLTQEYKIFNSDYSYKDAPEKLDELIDLFTHAKAKEMNDFGYLLIRWKKEIINSFIRVNGWRLSNGKMERANRYIKLMFSNAFGFSNFPRTRNRIMYSYNKDISITNKRKEFSNKRIFKSRGPYKKR